MTLIVVTETEAGPNWGTECGNHKLDTGHQFVCCFVSVEIPVVYDDDAHLMAIEHIKHWQIMAL